jgi:hypothetical protein
MGFSSRSNRNRREAAQEQSLGPWPQDFGGSDRMHFSREAAQDAD